MNRVQSEQLFAEALQYIPGGVNSPVRAFRAVGGNPFFVNKARGALVWDVDGNELIDYVGTWGPAILGHAHPKIISAIKSAADHGTSFGIPNPFEVKMAKLICEFVPSIKKVRMTNSGTEACMSAIRLARGFTKRDKIIKFDGCYHGHVDSLLVKAGSGALTFGNPDSAGVPAAFTQHTIVAPFNDVDAVKEIFAANKNQIAGIIVEPVPGNAGLYLPMPGYLEFLREITKANGALLIFDEVMTGFRLALGGAQERFGILPDLTTLGKIVGGGMPLAAYGGRADIMSKIAPTGPIYQAGTLSGNPMAVSAGIAMLRYLQSHPEVYEIVENRAAQLTANVPEGITVNRVGSMFTFFFTPDPVTDWESAKRADTGLFRRFFHWMLERGIYLAPSQFEAGFLSAAHSEQDIARTVETARQFFATAAGA